MYDLTDHFPDTERFRLIDPLCRAAISIPANIAESDGRFTRPDQLRFLYIARGSLCELQILVTIAEKRGYGSPERLRELKSLAEETGMLLNGFIRAKRKRMDADL